MQKFPFGDTLFHVGNLYKTGNLDTIIFAGSIQDTLFIGNQSCELAITLGEQNSISSISGAAFLLKLSQGKWSNASFDYRRFGSILPYQFGLPFAHFYPINYIHPLDSSIILLAMARANQSYSYSGDTLLRIMADLDFNSGNKSNTNQYSEVSIDILGGTIMRSDGQTELVAGRGARILIENSGTLLFDDIILRANSHQEGVSLHWSTSLASSIGDFEVQRIEISGEWKNISVQAIENLDFPNRSYSFVDSFPINGLNQYRIKVENLEGETQFSNVATTWL